MRGTRKQPTAISRARTKNALISAAGAVCALSTSLSIDAMAGTFTWANADGTFTNPAAWIGGVVPTNSNSTTGDVAVFPASGSIVQPNTNGNYGLAGIDVQGGGYEFSGGRFTVTAGTAGSVLGGINSTTNPTGSVTFNNVMVLGSNMTWNYTLDARFNGSIDTTGTSTARTLTLSGTGTSTFAGGINLNQTVGGVNSRLVTFTGTQFINIPGVIQATQGTGPNSIRYGGTGSGTVTVTGSNTYVGTTSFNGGTIAINGDAALGAVPAAFQANSIQVTGTSTLSLVAGAGTVALNANRGIQITSGRTFSISTNDANNFLQIDVPISETGAANFAKTGPGTLLLNSANTFTGNFVLDGGVTQFSNASAFGTNYIRLSGGTLEAVGGPKVLANQCRTDSLSTIGGSNDITFNGQWFYSPTGTTDRTEQVTNSGVTTLAGGVLISQSNGPRAFALTGTNGGVVISGPIVETASNAGTMTLNTAGTVSITSAANTYTGGTNANNGTVILGTVSTFGTGALNMGTTGFVSIASGRTSALALPALNVADPLNPGTLDLNDNDLVVASATPTADIVARVASARAGGNWNGPGITSTNARNNATTALGVLAGAEYTSVGGTSTFSGKTYGAADTLVKYTWNGDANLDGRVTFDDYVKIDTGFNTGLTGWLNGDFNYSGGVNFDDYVLIDIAFNQQNGTLGRAIDWISGDDRSATGLSGDAIETMLGHLDQFGSAYGAAFLAAVPEPTGALLLFAGVQALACTMRRGRHRHVARACENRV